MAGFNFPVNQKFMNVKPKSEAPRIFTGTGFFEYGNFAGTPIK